MKRLLPLGLALVFLASCGVAPNRQPPEGTPIETGIRVWMLGEPGSARFLVVISPWTYWDERVGIADFDRIMLEQTGHVFLCDAMTGSVARLCSIAVPEKVAGFMVEIEGARYRIIGWDADAAYIEMRAEPSRLEGSYEPFAWYRAARDGSCTSLNERPTALVYGYDIPGYPPARRGRGFPFPGADEYELVYSDGLIELGGSGVIVAKFTVDPVTYDIRAVDLGPDAKRALQEAMERQASGAVRPREEGPDDH